MPPSSSMLAPCALGAALLSGAVAAQPYPARPIRLIVPATPGGGSDVPSRIVAQALTDDLGWRFVVDNRGGASGRIGAEIAAKSPPDGYTLLVANTTPNAVVQGAVPNLPYDTLRDFAPVSLFATSDFNLVVHPSVPATTVKELIALARAKPGELRFGSVGNISGAHVTGELFKQLAGINIVHVPYKGANPGLADFYSGHLPMFAASISPQVLGMHRQGKIRILVAGSPRRLAGAPEIPISAEVGYPDLITVQFMGVFAPGGTPRLIIDQIAAATQKVTADKEFQQKMVAAGFEPVTDSGPDETAKFVAEELVRWTPLLKASQIKFN